MKSSKSFPINYQTRARPHQVPQSPRDNRTRTCLDDLPPEIKGWVAKTFGVCEIKPVDWLVNSNHCFRAFGKNVNAFFKVSQRSDALIRMEREKFILQHLYNLGLPVPHYLDSIALAPNMTCIAMEWIEALPLRYLDINGLLGKDYMSEFGYLARNLHKALATIDLPVINKQPRYDYDLNLVTATAERLLGPEIAMQLYEWVTMAQRFLSSWPQTPIHGDLQDKNLLLTQDGLLYICDFEAVREDVVLRDIFVDRFLLKATIEPDLRNLYQQKLCEGYGVERVERLLPDAWFYMRADFFATQLSWLEQNNVQELDDEQKTKWVRQISGLQKEISKGKAPKRKPDSKHLVPQWFFGVSTVLTSHPGFAPILKVVKQVFGETELRVDSQSNTIQSGVCIGIPDWQSTDWAKDGAVLLLNADEKLLELKTKFGVIINPEPGVLLEINSEFFIRFLPATKQQDVSLILVRPRKKNTPSPIPRENCRIFPPKPKEILGSWEAIGKITFRSEAHVLSKMPRKTTWQDIVQEPSMSQMRIVDALALGGQLVREFIDALPEDWRNPDADVVISVKRNELAPGWNPTYVGWHFDGTHRANCLPNGKTDLRNPGNTVDQIIACCGSGAPTQFLLGEVELSEFAIEKEQNTLWQKELDVAVKNGTLKHWFAPIDTLVFFGFGAFHTGSVSVVPGWRCFIKAMRRRGDISSGRLAERSNISWVPENPGLPTDPCGVFPDTF